MFKHGEPGTFSETSSVGENLKAQTCEIFRATNFQEIRDNLSMMSANSSTERVYMRKMLYLTNSPNGLSLFQLRSKKSLLRNMTDKIQYAEGLKITQFSYPLVVMELT